MLLIIVTEEFELTFVFFFCSRSSASLINEILLMLKHRHHISNGFHSFIFISEIWNIFIITIHILIKEEFYKLKYCSTVVYMVPRA